MRSKIADAFLPHCSNDGLHFLQPMEPRLLPQRQCVVVYEVQAQEISLNRWCVIRDEMKALLSLLSTHQ